MVFRVGLFLFSSLGESSELIGRYKNSAVRKSILYDIPVKFGCCKFPVDGRSLSFQQPNTENSGDPARAAFLIVVIDSARKVEDLLSLA